MKRMLKVAVLCALMVSIASSGYCSQANIQNYIRDNFTSIDTSKVKFSIDKTGWRMYVPITGEMVYNKSLNTLVINGKTYKGMQMPINDISNLVKTENDLYLLGHKNGQFSGISVMTLDGFLLSNLGKSGEEVILRQTWLTVDIDSKGKVEKVLVRNSRIGKKSTNTAPKPFDSAKYFSDNFIGIDVQAGNIRSNVSSSGWYMNIPLFGVVEYNKPSDTLTVDGTKYKPLDFSKDGIKYFAADNGFYQINCKNEYTDGILVYAWNKSEVGDLKNKTEEDFARRLSMIIDVYPNGNIESILVRKSLITKSLTNGNVDGLFKDFTAIDARDIRVSELSDLFNLESTNPYIKSMRINKERMKYLEVNNKRYEVSDSNDDSILFETENDVYMFKHANNSGKTMIYISIISKDGMSFEEFDNLEQDAMESRIWAFINVHPERRNHPVVLLRNSRISGK